MNTREFSNRLNSGSQIASSSFDSANRQYQALKTAIVKGEDVSKQLVQMDQRMQTLNSAISSFKRINDIANSSRFNRTPNYF